LIQSAVKTYISQQQPTEMKKGMLMLCVSLAGYICPAQEKQLASSPHEQLYSTTEPDHGVRQSPINILSSNSKHTARPKIVFNYHPSTETVVRPGHTVQVIYDTGNTLRYEGRLYDLKQFHFHTPSEHLIDGITYPMEMHMVHVLKQEGNQAPVYLVIGLFFREGKANPFLDKFIDAIPDSTGAINHLPDQYINISDLLAQAKHLRYYHYEGSLTTAPYSETVSWFLVKHVLEASPEQIEKINSIEGNNARHIQDLHLRTIDNN
jgi:carbonic anhydrase